MPVPPAPEPVDHHRLTLGEGPGYDPATDTAWWFDIAERRLFTRDLGGGGTRVSGLPLAASAMAVTGAGEQILLTERGLFRRDPGSGALAPCRLWQADARIRSNDARVHPCGAFWISTAGKEGETGLGAILHCYRGEMRLLWRGLTMPNAICFSPDGGTAWFADTPTGRIRQVRTDPATGLPTGPPRDFHHFPGGLPDGAVSDARGRLWVALWGRGVLVALGRDGETADEIRFPAPNVTCPAWIGRGADRLAVTSARAGMDRLALARHPQAGATFVLPAPVPGRLDPPVQV